MPVTRLIEKWSGKIEEITLGGMNARTVKIGGANTLPFSHEDGLMPNRPVVAMEVLDAAPTEWPAALVEPFKDVINNPAQWAKKCEEVYKADMICLKLVGAHPENKNTSVAEVVKIVKAVKDAVKIPLILWGTGNAEKDAQLFPACSQALKGERCLLGTVVQDNYKMLAATCIADGHSIIAESPLDINICKQMNLLLQDMDFPLNRIVIYPTTGALGYGFEYAYSIMERTRLAALSGDKVMGCPILAVVGSESWNTKEAKVPEAEKPEWGSAKERGIIWEASTATGFLLAGADIVVMSHPEAVALTQNYIAEMMKK
jgi:acetyl-CoA decarbonylase/synthase, CODH/ACS complex subunit delta